MFDTVKPYFYMTDMVLDRLHDQQALKNLDTKFYRNKFYLHHPFGLKNPAVYFDMENRNLHTETSLPKLLQGHNVFGTNRLEYLCLATIKLIYKQLGLMFTSRERRVIRDEGIRLGRLDGTCSFRLTTPQQVAEALEVICDQLRAEGLHWSAYGQFDIETVYNQQRSTRVTDKFYDKFVELMRKKMDVGVAERAWILKFVSRLLRFEVTWRAKELNRLELEYADLWSPELLKQMMQERLDGFNFQGVIRDRLATEQLDNLNASCQTFYGLWTQGAKLGAYSHNRTLDRARDHLLKRHQVDIYRPAGVGCCIPLKKLLTTDNAYFTAPKYLTRRGAIFGFEKPVA